MPAFNKLFIEKNILKNKNVQRIAATVPKNRIIQITSYKNLPVQDSIDNEKKCLVLAQFRGDSVKEFRRLDGLTQRKEYYIVYAQNCFYDCQYCFLQCYSDNAYPVLFINHNKILRDVETVLKSEKRPFFYTGELADSMAFDPVTDFNQKLIKLFSRYPNGTLELRTKCTHTALLLKIVPIKNIILSWTFTPQAIIDQYEKRTASLTSRISAARECQKKGYQIGLRLDPIIAYQNGEEDYAYMIKQLMESLNHDRIESVVLGIFRFTPALEKIIRKRFPKSDITINECVPCIDGKWRYLKSMRIAIYKSIIARIRQYAPQVKITLCMETPEVWNEVF
ncbi:MAG: hypothetical protein P9M13_10545 [Candidatus Ancaeobacter aquaticus]|nr:hypothetical protein [Candidatus Ancaeobacter aquaticus]